MKVPMLDLPGQYEQLKDEINAAIQGVLDSGRYIMGPAVSEFETNIARFLGVKQAIGVASGSDALLLSLHALGIGAGDKVIVPTFTFFATAGAVSRLGAHPVFVDIDTVNYNLDLDQVEAILKQEKTVKAIIPVHLFGLPCHMERLMQLARRHNMIVVEDACQAIAAELPYQGENKQAGTIGHTGCFSFFPSKNLGCFGDGGLVVTNDQALADKLRLLRVHGSQPKYFHQEIGYNSRMDAVQAAVLNVKLKYLRQWTAKRCEVARKYNQEFLAQGLKDQVVCPQIARGHVFHQYVIQVENRDELAACLRRQGVATSIYYPLPLHLQQCYRELGYEKGSLPIAEEACKKVLALPIDPELTAEEIKYIVSSIKEFIEKRQ